MIITDNFVLLAFPKTGTTYTTNALRTIHARRGLLGRVWPQRWQKRDFPRPGYREHRIELPAAPPYHKARMTRHGTYRDIPVQERDKLIASIIRNPFTRYTSAYLFQTRMRKHLRPVAAPEVLKSAYPGYPELSFADYYDMLQRFETPRELGGITPAIELGSQTVHFINFYFRDPEAVFRRIDRDYIEQERFREDMADIYFMHQESLRDEFGHFLRKMGYSDLECELASSQRQKNVAERKKEETSLGHFYDDALRQRVLERDALIFKMFPEYATPDWG